MQRMEKITAVITGAAGGLGAALAREAVRRGMKLVVTDIEEEPLSALAKELAEVNGDVLALPCDIRHASSADALAAAARDRFGAVHVIINNAGVGRCGFIWELTDAEWDWVLDVNLRSAVHMIRAFFPGMLQAARTDPDFRGHVINVASVAGFLNAPLLGPYNVSKHAMVSLSETLYHDLRLCNAPVAVSVLCPHFVNTGIAASDRNWPEAQHTGSSRSESRTLAQEILEKALNTAVVTPEQVAKTTWDAVGDGRFYIFSHPEVLPSIDARFSSVLAQKFPADPYADMPSLQAYMHNRLAGNW